MEKQTFLKQDDFNKWFDACAKDYYMDGRMPKKYPCVVSWVEVPERNSFKFFTCFHFLFLVLKHPYCH